MRTSGASHGHHPSFSLYSLHLIPFLLLFHTYRLLSFQRVVPRAIALACSTLTRSHRACYGVLRFVMESGAKGCEVVVSGKLRAARAKSMKFTDGFMIHSGQPARDYVDYAVRHVLLRQGVLGIKVKM